MDNGLLTDVTSGRAGRIVDRCRGLRVTCWRINRQCEAECMSAGTDPVSRWWGAPQWASQVARLAERLANQDEVGVLEPFPGGWLAPITGGGTGRGGERWIVAGLGEDAIASEWCEAIAATVSAPLSVIRNGLEPWAIYNVRSFEALIKTLSWMLEDGAVIDDGGQAIDEFSEKLTQAYEESNLLFKIARFANSLDAPAQVIDAIAHQLSAVLPFQWIGFRFIDDPVVVAPLRDQTMIAGDPPVPTHTLVYEIDKQIRGTRHDSWTRLLTPGEHALADLTHGEILMEPLVHQDDTIGVLIAGNKQGDDNEVSSADTQFLDATADFLGVFHENASRFDEQNRAFLGTLKALTASIDAKDPYTRGHSERVSMLGHQLALAIGLDRSTAERVRIAGLVHDVGKIGVPEAVLRKAARLTDEEFAQIKKHPQIGYEILRDIPMMADVLPGVLEHHERFDGRGYPNGVSGENISLFGRILALADTFDAMSSNRAYRDGMARDVVLAEIQRCSGAQFDPALVPHFIALDFTKYDDALSRTR